MTLLRKGQNAPLPGTAVRVVIGWSHQPGGPDVDVAALLLGVNGKVSGDTDFIFYNQPGHASGSVRHTGKKGATDTVEIDVPKVPAAVERIIIGASADGGTFGQLSGLFLQILDAGSGAELVRFEIEGATTETAFLFGELYRRQGEWKLRAVGQGYDTGLGGFATDFGVSVDDEPAAAPAAAASVSLKKQQLVDMEKKVAAAAPALLSLTKRAAVSLEKRGLGEHTARVALCLDISLSMRRLYESGKIQALAERILALGLRFDDDGAVDVFLFAKKGRTAGTMELANHAEFIAEAVGGPENLELGTQYGVAMKLIRRHYFGDDGPRTAPHPDPVPVYVMFITDGETYDKDVTADQVRSSSYEPLFWQFIAIGNTPKSVDAKFGAKPRAGGERFKFLEELDDLSGRYLDNADFFSVSDPANIPDEDLYDLLMNEYPGWLQQARAKGLVTG